MVGGLRPPCAVLNIIRFGFGPILHVGIGPQGLYKALHGLIRPLRALKGSQGLHSALESLITGLTGPLRAI